MICVTACHHKLLIMSYRLTGRQHIGAAVFDLCDHQQCCYSNQHRHHSFRVSHFTHRRWTDCAVVLYERLSTAGLLHVSTAHGVNSCQYHSDVTLSATHNDTKLSRSPPPSALNVTHTYTPRYTEHSCCRRTTDNWCDDAIARTGWRHSHAHITTLHVSSLCRHNR